MSCLGLVPLSVEINTIGYKGTKNQIYYAISRQKTQNIKLLSQNGASIDTPSFHRTKRAKPPYAMERWRLDHEDD